jgi:hypothetical protein
LSELALNTVASLNSFELACFGDYLRILKQLVNFIIHSYRINFQYSLCFISSIKIFKFILVLNWMHQLVRYIVNNLKALSRNYQKRSFFSNKNFVFRQRTAFFSLPAKIIKCFLNYLGWYFRSKMNRAPKIPKLWG